MKDDFMYRLGRVSDEVKAGDILENTYPNGRVAQFRVTSIDKNWITVKEMANNGMQIIVGRVRK